MIKEVGEADNNLTIGGKWINRNTGKIINIINNIIDGNDMQLICSDGTVLSMDQFGDYIQATDEEVAAQVSTNIASTNKANIEYQKDYTDYMLDDDISYASPNKNSVKETPKKQENKANPILDKFFSKIKNIDDLVNITINTDILPIKDLQMIMEYMDISSNDISKYISENLIDLHYISNIVNQEINKLFLNDSEIIPIYEDTEENNEEDAD